MTHEPPKETCWLYLGTIEVCTVTPHIQHESDPEWDRRHNQAVADDMDDFPCPEDDVVEI